MEICSVLINIIISIICLLLSFFFSMAETTFTCINKFRFMVEAKYQLYLL